MEAACWYPKPVLPIYNAVRKVAFATLAKTVFNDEKKVSLIKISKMVIFDFWKLATL